MKKLILPTLLASLVLCGCNVQPIEKPEPKFDAVEDTDADDLLFENAKLVNDFEVTDSSVPSIGIQRTNEYTDHLAIRFIAAIKVNDTNNNGTIEQAELDATSAVWVRDVFSSDGSAAGTSVYGGPGEKPSHTAYVAFNNGGSRYTIEQFNADHGTSYTHFVTYVLKNIEQGAFAYNVMNVYLKLNQTTYSKCAVTTIDGLVNFSIDYDKTGFFGVIKKSDGSFEFFEPEDTNETRTYFKQHIGYGDSFLFAYRQTGDDSRCTLYNYFDRNYHLGIDSGLIRDGDSIYFKASNQAVYLRAGFAHYPSYKHQATMCLNVKDKVITSGESNATGSLFESGMYPQNHITDSELIAELEQTVQTPNGWYVYNHEYYANLVATPYSNEEYFDDHTPIVAGETYWFKCEPITWVQYINNTDRPGDSRMHASVLILDKHSYSDTSSEQTTKYINSDLRSYFANVFYATAFPFGGLYEATTPSIWNNVITTGDDTNPYSTDGDIRDYVFTLCRYELKWPESAWGNSSNSRKRKSTEWARCRGLHGEKIDNNYYSSYWTRSPAPTEGKAYIVDTNGSVDTSDNITAVHGVLPVIVL